MRMLDLKCPKCGAVVVDYLERDEATGLPFCREVMDLGITGKLVCATRMERVYLPTNRGTVIGDDIPGGLEVKNGLCNADGTPQRFYSKSAIAAEAVKRGMTNFVTHVGSKGSDKSRHTSRWV
jgi:hypothetical protein